MAAATDVGLGLMIEGQEGLTWERWRRLCGLAEELGFESLWRSDHNYSTFGEPQRDCIDTWTSLALCAEWTRRVQFGPLVSPMTFRQPGMLARTAASVDVLSGGRLVLGLGAGWYEAEHRDFGIPFPGLKERVDCLESGIARIREVWRLARPQPPRGGSVPILIGAGGERRTLGITAREAAEWNWHPPSVELYAVKAAALDAHCRSIGRDPGSIRRSVMFAYLIGRDRSEVLRRAEAMREVVPRYTTMSAEEILEASQARTLTGTPAEIAEKMRPYAAMGVTRFMFQHFLMDDDDGLRLLIEEVPRRL